MQIFVTILRILLIIELFMSCLKLAESKNAAIDVSDFLIIHHLVTSILLKVS